MTKPIRNDAPGAVHHVTARVNWRVWHLKSRGRARFFMQALVKAAESFAVNLLAFVLMSNHFHLVLRSPEEAKYRELTGRRTRCRHFRPWPRKHANATVLAQAMRRLMYTVSRNVHAELDLTGQFWEGPFHSRPITDSMDLTVTMAYDHRNPVRAGMTLRPEDHGCGSAAWWAGTGPSPVPLLEYGGVPFGLTVEELRREVIRYQRSRHLDDVLGALRKEGIEWYELEREARRELLERAGLAWSGACGITAAGHDR